MAKTHICFSSHDNMAFNSYMEGVFGMTKTKVIGKCFYCKENVGYCQSYCHVEGNSLAHVGCRNTRGSVIRNARSSVMELFKYSKLNTERDAYDKVLALIDKEMKA